MNEDSSIKGKLHSLKRKSKFKTVTRIDFQGQGAKQRGRLSREDGSPLNELHDSFAFNPSKFLNKPRTTHSVPRKAVSALRSAATTVQNPKKSFKAQAARLTAGKLAKPAKPFHVRKADEAFLDAYDDLEKAKAHENGGDVECPDEADNIDRTQSRIDGLQTERETMRIAWMTERHVHRVKAVDIRPRPFPSVEFFETKDDCGATEFQWGTWLGYKLLQYSRPFTVQYIDDFEELPYDSEDLRRHIERLITVSAPLETWLASLRRLYRWDNPTRTATWMVIYFVIWYISHIMTFMYGYLVYSVLHNYYYPTTLEGVQQAMERTSVTAMEISEIINSKGHEKRLDPMLNSFGPHIQLQVADLANFLEMLYNFYHWQRPAKTRATLILLFTLFLVCLLTDTDFCLRGLYLLGWLTFFVFWPISSRYPRYRLLISLPRWVFWDVPTHAEWTFQYLQERSITIRQEVEAENAKKLSITTDDNDAPSNDSTAMSSDIQTSDIASFPCTHINTPGRLVLSFAGFRFEAKFVKSSSDPVRFHFKYSDLQEMCKSQSNSTILAPIAKLTSELDSLDLKVKRENRKVNDETGRVEDHVIDTFRLENMIGRDKAFNSIIGFSGIQWRNV